MREFLYECGYEDAFTMGVTIAEIIAEQNGYYSKELGSNEN